MCCIIFSELKKLNATFIRKVRIVTQSKFSRKVWFQVFISQRIFPKTYFQHKVYRQSSVRFSIFPQNFSVTISINFFRKNRRKAFGVSSENMLHTTFCSLAKWRKSKHKCSVLHKSSIEELLLILALNPPFCQTAVVRSFFFPLLFGPIYYLIFETFKFYNVKY